MEHGTKIIKSLKVLSPGAGVLLVLIGGFRMGIQSLDPSNSSILNPLNIVCLVGGIALLMYSVAVSLMLRFRRESRGGDQETQPLRLVRKR
jgi:hypothetical protein